MFAFVVVVVAVAGEGSFFCVEWLSEFSLTFALPFARSDGENKISNKKKAWANFSAINFHKKIFYQFSREFSLSQSMVEKGEKKKSFEAMTEV